MGKIISLVNQKGGVGKTTTSINLSAALGQLGKKVLLIDMDPQSNTTTGLGISSTDFSGGIYELITGQIEVKKAIKKTKYKNLHLIPATLNLAGVDFEFIRKVMEDHEFCQNDQLKLKLEEIREMYDYIIIDCQPSLGIGTMNALVASDSVIIPVQCEYYALHGVAQLLNSIIMVQDNMNKDLRIEGVLLTMYDARTKSAYEVVEGTRKYFKDKVFETIIPRLVRLVEAPSHGKPINEYDPTSRASEAYSNLAKEVISRNGN